MKNWKFTALVSLMAMVASASAHTSATEIAERIVRFDYNDNLLDASFSLKGELCGLPKGSLCHGLEFSNVLLDMGNGTQLSAPAFIVITEDLAEKTSEILFGPAGHIEFLLGLKDAIRVTDAKDQKKVDALLKPYEKAGVRTDMATVSSIEFVETRREAIAFVGHTRGPVVVARLTVSIPAKPSKGVDFGSTNPKVSKVELVDPKTAIKTPYDLYEVTFSKGINLEALK